MFQISFTPEAIEDLRWFVKEDRKTIMAKLETQLRYEPTLETRNRKRLRPNQLRNGNCDLDHSEFSLTWKRRTA